MVEGIRPQNLNDLQSTRNGVHHQTQFHSFFQNPFSNLVTMTTKVLTTFYIFQWSTFSRVISQDVLKKNK